MESEPAVLKSSLSRYWNEIDWGALRRLRARFLEFDDAAASAASDYWENDQILRSYDLTFGERIGWKWDFVLDELVARGWAPPKGTVLDYGCGSGVAGRRVLAQWPGVCERVLFSDRSRAAMQYSVRTAREAFPHHVIEQAAGESLAPQTLILSHVLNELDAAGLEAIVELAMRAEAILWVEPGTAAVSRKLISVRERLLSTFAPIAPCPHAGPCGLLQGGNERHWCHHFAKPPSEVFQDGAWTRFSQALEIDLTALPLTYLVLDRRAETIAFQSGKESRVIGRPRFYKGYHKIFSCQAESVEELILQKRDDAALHKAIKKECGTLYRWKREGEKIRTGERLV